MPDTITVNVNVPEPTPVTVDISEARDAYQIAVAEGFVGTRAEWLASLQGPQGDAGAAGAAGAQGPAGADGAQGPPGADAPDGAIVSDVTGVAGADVIANIISLTQAEYDAIGTPASATLYVIV